MKAVGLSRETATRFNQATTIFSEIVGFLHAYIVKLLTPISSITVNDETCMISAGIGTRTASLRDAARERDRCCVITGRRVVSARGAWTGFKAAHIFPLAYGARWEERGCGRWVSIPPATESVGSTNSVRNRILLKADIHALFNGYSMSINPDDNYKIVYFNTNRKGIAGGHLDREFLEDPSRLVD